MIDMNDIDGFEYIVWVEYECEGWSPWGYHTLEEALADWRKPDHGHGKVITPGIIPNV